MKTRTHRSRICQALRAAILLGMVSGAALANTSPVVTASAKAPLCYCHCEHMNGGKQCTKMCELPQYENRWWAASCHKKTVVTKEPVSQPSNSGSRKTNRTEEAMK